MPSLDTVNRALAAIKIRADYEYFFENLKSPSWIEPLRQAGLFREPERPIREGQFIQYPAWPPSQYLVRMAALAPQAVADVIQQIPATDNFRVNEDFADAVLAMPEDIAVELVPLAKQWAAGDLLGFLPEKVGKLIQRFAEAGYVSAALELSEILLRLTPDPRKEEKKEYRLSLEPRPAFSEWEYEQILRDNVPALVSAAELQSVALLSDLLDRATALSFEDHNGPEDYTYISRPAIEDNEHNMDRVAANARNLLITSVRDAAEQLLREKLASVEDVVALLGQHRWHVFERLILHIVRLFAPQSALSVQYLTDRHFFDGPDYHHEYVLLARAAFATLPTQAQEHILAWGHNGPPLERYKARIEELTGSAPTQDMIDSYIRDWRSKQFNAFRTEVPAHLLDQHTWLRELRPVEEDDEFESLIKVQTGSVSPLSSDDLMSMSIEDIAEFLNSWTPTDIILGESTEGLANQLSEVVAATPERFANGAESFEGIDAVYLAVLFQGWEKAAKQSQTFAWQPVLNFCVRVLERTLALEKLSNSSDPTNSWTRANIARLLQTGFGQQSEIPFELRTLAWRALQVLTNDADPTEQTEQKYGVIADRTAVSSWEPSTLAINTVRGIAMHGVVAYALWVRRHLAPSNGAPIRSDFRLMPEIQEVLDAHLDPDRDPSMAIRSVYGQLLPFLTNLDKEWVAQNVERIFPQEGALQTFREAAWRAYVVFNPPYLDVYKLLRGEYEMAVNAVAHTTGPAESHLPGTEIRLAEHLMNLYWQGSLPLEDDLLTKFFATSSDELRAHSLEYVGFSLRHAHNANEEVPPEVLARLQALWEKRFATLNSEGITNRYSKELASFGDWFSSSVFDDKWALNTLEAVLLQVKSVRAGHLVIERLADLVGQMPLQAVRCLSLMIKGNPKSPAYTVWNGPIERILTSAVHSQDAEAKEEAVNLIHYMGAMGYRDVGKLLPEANDDQK